VEAAILNLKREKPYWGARKIRERLLRRFSCEVRVPARSTIHAVLDRHGLVQRRGRKRHHAQGTPLSLGQKPNQLLCTDYKGEFLLGNKKYCYPLTVTDHASRYLLLCEALESTCGVLPIRLTTASSRSPAADGSVCIAKKINLSTVFAGQAVGIKEVEEGIWLVSFMEYDLGYIDLEENTLQALDNPFRPKNVTHVAGTFCHPCVRAGPAESWSGRWESNPRPRLGKPLFYH
jgi:hypothetical protein